MGKVIVIDTSILCVWLKVPGKEECGDSHDKWNYKRVKEKIDIEEKRKSTLALPLASIIETGNHIAQSNGDRFSLSNALADIIIKTAKKETPWAAFSFQEELWSPEKLMDLAKCWPNLAVRKISIGDATIKDVAEYYSKAGYEVEIFTGDKGLKAFEPVSVIKQPRRRK